LNIDEQQCFIHKTSNAALTGRRKPKAGAVPPCSAWFGVQQIQDPFTGFPAGKDPDPNPAHKREWATLLCTCENRSDLDGIVLQFLL
jgi:hypothetical protein